MKHDTCDINKHDIILYGIFGNFFVIKNSMSVQVPASTPITHTSNEKLSNSAKYSDGFRSERAIILADMYIIGALTNVQINMPLATSPTSASYWVAMTNAPGATGGSEWETCILIFSRCVFVCTWRKCAVKKAVGTQIGSVVKIGTRIHESHCLPNDQR